MKKGYLHQLIYILWDAIRKLDGDVEPLELEHMAIRVYKAMDYKTRIFHSMEHVFNFLDSSDPVIALAAVFHDLVYLQVDRGLPPPLKDLFEPYLQIEGTRVTFLPLALESKEFQLCCTLFGRDSSHPLDPPNGMNEFLSGFSFCLCMQGKLNYLHLGSVLLCIEATIPFRGLDSEGRTVGEVLEARARIAFPEVSEEIIQRMVHRAIGFANRDVQDFCNPDTAAFLSNTWKLLPETNIPLQDRGSYSIREYRIALYGMLNFFRSLDPERIFHSYRGKPSDKDLQNFRKVARINLALSIQYLKAKLLAVSTLEALAILSGGDAPIALFMGDLNALHADSECLIRYLPTLPFPPWLDENHPVVRLLRDGRLEESSFDLRNSPLALWLYKRLRPEVWGRIVVEMERFFKGELSPEEFLFLFPRSSKERIEGPLLDIVKALSQMAPTRERFFQVLLTRGTYST
ncbi:MAG: hypothetical protein N2442_10565 [Spirochaetes bacterium]|nr:hypothetical protein [Spirochaetota bacterium]